METLGLEGFIARIEEGIREHDPNFQPINLLPSNVSADMSDFSAKDMEKVLSRKYIIPVDDKLATAKIALRKRLEAGVTYEDLGYRTNAAFSYERSTKSANFLIWHDVSIILLERALSFPEYTSAFQSNPVEVMTAYAKLAEAQHLTGNFDDAKKTLKICEDLGRKAPGILEGLWAYTRTKSRLEAGRVLPTLDSFQNF